MPADPGPARSMTSRKTQGSPQGSPQGSLGNPRFSCNFFGILKTTSSLIISTSSILTVNLFFNSLIKLSTKISGADAPEEIPIVFEFWINDFNKILQSSYRGKMINDFKELMN